MSIIRIEKAHLKAGVLGGVIAGVVFGAMLGMLGMLPVIAKLGGGESALFGFALHLIFSVIIGAIFSIFFGHAAVDRARGISLGLLYGLIWWFLGPLIIMPVLLGMGVQLTASGMAAALPSLWGHLVYGFILGWVYSIVAGKSKHSNA